VSETTTKLSEYITENFGANATYVEGLLSRYQADPNLVDESWRTFFADLLTGNGREPAKADAQPAASVAPTTAGKESTAAKPAPAATQIPPGAETKPLTGAAKKIVENMEQSLTVPTATSLRSIPVKVLEENRRIINDHLQQQGRGKVSFTHLIAWAIVKAVKDYPQMNNGFGVVNNAPSRIENHGINLGIAIDIEKKDGTRNLLVPNIKGGEKGTRWQTRDRRLSGHYYFADEPWNYRNRRFEPAAYVRPKRDHRNRGDRIPCRISSDDRRGSFAARHQQDSDAHQHLRSPCDPGS
jgi:2-oxoglutarate dehydrogenase E1 component